MHRHMPSAPSRKFFAYRLCITICQAQCKIFAQLYGTSNERERMREKEREIKKEGVGGSRGTEREREVERERERGRGM